MQLCSDCNKKRFWASMFYEVITLIVKDYDGVLIMYRVVDMGWEDLPFIF